VQFLTYIPEFLNGLWLTTSVSFLAFAGALVLGVLGALARRSRFWPLKAVGTVYVEALRNTPALVQIFLVFFGLPAMGIHLPAYMAGVVALALNAGAYLTEIIRAGLEAVPSGQLEAARSLGMTRTDSFLHVALPQAMRTVYPPVMNEFMQLILSTSLLSVIALDELTGVALIVNSLTFETMQAFGLALVLYLVLTNLVSFGAALLARVIFRPPLKVDVKQLRKTPTTRLRVLAGGR
jgi:polar amino acid transport system permease protein